MSDRYRPNPGQTGTGVSREADATASDLPPVDATDEDVDPGVATAARTNADASVPGAEPNRSGSGGSGGSRPEDPGAEGSTGATTKELHEGR